VRRSGLQSCLRSSRYQWVGDGGWLSETGDSARPLRHDHPAITGPKSRWFQSSGWPSASTGPPPPHLSPANTASAPSVCLTATTGTTLTETSTPVAGQVATCVDRAHGAVGLPCSLSAVCCSHVRNPLMTMTANGSLPAMLYSFRTSWGSIFHRSAIALIESHNSSGLKPSVDAGIRWGINRRNDKAAVAPRPSGRSSTGRGTGR